MSGDPGSNPTLVYKAKLMTMSVDARVAYPAEVYTQCEVRGL